MAQQPPSRILAEYFIGFGYRGTWHLVIKHSNIWHHQDEKGENFRQTDKILENHLLFTKKKYIRLEQTVPLYFTGWPTLRMRIVVVAPHETSSLPAGCVYVEVFLLKCVAKHLSSLSEYLHETSKVRNTENPSTKSAVKWLTHKTSCQIDGG